MDTLIGMFWTMIQGIGLTLVLVGSSWGVYMAISIYLRSKREWAERTSFDGYRVERKPPGLWTRMVDHVLPPPHTRERERVETPPRERERIADRSAGRREVPMAPRDRGVWFLDLTVQGGRTLLEYNDQTTPAWVVDAVEAELVKVSAECGPPLRCHRLKFSDGAVEFLT